MVAQEKTCIFSHFFDFLRPAKSSLYLGLSEMNFSRDLGISPKSGLLNIMAKQLHRGDIVLIPKNFSLKQHRNMFARVDKIEGDTLTLSTMDDTFIATKSDVTAKRSLTVDARWEILSRDNFRCRVCGHHAGTTRTLHVDHARSFHEGGKTEDLDNLWTLCSLCNSGKRSKSIAIFGEPMEVSDKDISLGRDLIREVKEASLYNAPISAEKVNQVADLAERLMKDLLRMKNELLWDKSPEP